MISHRSLQRKTHVLFNRSLHQWRIRSWLGSTKQGGRKSMTLFSARALQTKFLWAFAIITYIQGFRFIVCKYETCILSFDEFLNRFSDVFFNIIAYCKQHNIPCFGLWKITIRIIEIYFPWRCLSCFCLLHMIIDHILHSIPNTNNTNRTK